MGKSKTKKIDKSKTNSKKKHISKNKIKTRSQSKANKSMTTTITKTDYDKLEFPYHNIGITLDDIKKNLKQLAKFKPITISRNPTQKPIKRFKGKNVIFVEDYYKYKHMYQITDYFSQKCRVHCIYNTKHYNQKKSIHQLFQDNKTDIYKKVKNDDDSIDLENVREYMYHNKFKECTNFNTTIVVSVLKLFKPKRYLDFSAGWGDRLVGAIAYGKCKYTGVDPSKCMKPVYKEIVKALVPLENRKHYKVIDKGFEEADIKYDYYDLIFTSPPFFDLEIYEDCCDQSIEKFNTFDKWINGFLYPSIVKCRDALQKDGHLALYISDYTEHYFVGKMKQYIKDTITDLKYVGDIHWWDTNNKKQIRVIFVWQKIE